MPRGRSSSSRCGSRCVQPDDRGQGRTGLVGHLLRGGELAHHDHRLVAVRAGAAGGPRQDLAHGLRAAGRRLDAHQGHPAAGADHRGPLHAGAESHAHQRGTWSRLRDRVADRLGGGHLTDLGTRRGQRQGGGGGGQQHADREQGDQPEAHPRPCAPLRSRCSVAGRPGQPPQGRGRHQDQERVRDRDVAPVRPRVVRRDRRTVEAEHGHPETDEEGEQPAWQLTTSQDRAGPDGRQRGRSQEGHHHGDRSQPPHQPGDAVLGVGAQAVHRQPLLGLQRPDELLHARQVGLPGVDEPQRS